MYMGPPLKDQRPPARIIPAGVTVTEALPGAATLDPVVTIPVHGRLSSQSQAARKAEPDPPGAQARSTRGSAGPRAGTQAEAVLAWMARQPGPVTQAQCRAAVPMATTPLEAHVTNGYLARRRYRGDGMDGKLVVQFALPGRAWPPLPAGAVLLREDRGRVGTGDTP